MDDVTRLRRALADVDRAARGQRWDAKRPWRVHTHVFWQADMPTVDGHDLSAKLMKRVLSVLLEEGGALDTGAFLVVTGRGRHSLGGTSVLAKVVRGTLGPQAHDRGWRLTSWGPAAWVVVVDPRRAPRSATGSLGIGTWLVYAAIAAATGVTVLRWLGWL